MDTYEATRIVLSRIQSLDPENASKIMGVLLIQDHGEKEMIRLAFGPEALVHSVVLKARKELGLASSSPSTPSTPSSPSPPFLANNHHHPFSLSRQNSTTSSRLAGVVGGATNLPSPLSIPNHSTCTWAASCYSDYQTHDDLISPNSSSTSYPALTSNSSINSSASPFYGSGTTDLIDEFRIQDQLSFLNDLGPKSHDLYYPHQDLASSPGGDAGFFPSYGGTANPHRRSCSVNDICLGSEDPACGFGWKPCLYYARGYCKNGNSCRFLHTGLADSDGGVMVGSPNKLDMMEHCHELLRSKSAHAQQHRFATTNSQLMASSTFPYSSAAANKYVNLLLQQQQSDTQRAAAALMMGDEMHKFGRSRLERNDFLMNPGSRQIYLTFPADSTFREEDVSNYFSIYGPVQDVRIPYQQKRMFGFVTFVYPETVKLILAKGNPHFVCDARVLVKPYKEKGKIPDKFRKQQMERGEYTGCGSPTGLDSRDPYDLQLGARMFGNTQDALWRRKMEEQAELQQALDLQGQRLMGLQLLDLKRHNHHRTLSTGAAIPSPINSPSFFNQSALPFDRSSPEATEENGSKPAMAFADMADQVLQQAAKLTEKESSVANGTEENGNRNDKDSPHQHEESDLPESLEDNLPDNLFASPKASGDYTTAFNSGCEAEMNVVALTASVANNNLITSSLLPANSTMDVASFKSCYFHVPRFSPGHGAIGM